MPRQRPPTAPLVGRRLLVLVVLLAACGPPQMLPDGSPTWQSDAFVDTLPADPVAAFVAHARAAVLQSHGITYVEDWADAELVRLARLWCDDGASVHSDVIGRELDRRGFDVTPGRDFVPPPPVDQLLTRVAGIHGAQLCAAL